MSDEDKIAIARLTERVDNLIDKSASNYVNKSEEMSEIKASQIKTFQMLYDLPCKERKAWYSLMNRTVWAIWVVLVGAIGVGIAHLGWK